MADARFAGNAIRRRMGEPSSHLGMIEDPKAGEDQTLDQWQDTVNDGIAKPPLSKEFQ